MFYFDAWGFWKVQCGDKSWTEQSQIQNRRGAEAVHNNYMGGVDNMDKNKKKGGSFASWVILRNGTECV
jgi:hypothetical protein